MAQGLNKFVLAALCVIALAFDPGQVGAKSHRVANDDGNGLRVNFYARKCRRAEGIVKAAVVKAYRADRTIPAGLIRLHFHDCFVRGCDASVLIKGINGGLTEMDGPPNANSLRGFEVIDDAKAGVEAVCPGVVSCADILAFAARDAIELAARTRIDKWYGGRRDGLVSNFLETLTALPSPASDFSTLRTIFQQNNLTTQEMILLSGAHSIGHAHCGVIFNRLYSFNGTGQPDPTIDPAYVKDLQKLCPSTSPGKLVDMDQVTPLVLDRNYFRDVLTGRGMFTSDNALRTTRFGVRVARQARIRPDFVHSMRRMGTIGVLIGSPGEAPSEIRKVCSAIN